MTIGSRPQWTGPQNTNTTFRAQIPGLDGVNPAPRAIRPIGAPRIPASMKIGPMPQGGQSMPMAPPRAVTAAFGTPEYYQQRAEILSGMTGDPVGAFNGSAAQVGPTLSQTNPGAWRGRVIATTGQDPVAPGMKWAAPVMPQRDPRAAMARALMRRGSSAFGPRVR